MVYELDIEVDGEQEVVMGRAKTGWSRQKTDVLEVMIAYFLNFVHHSCTSLMVVNAEM